MCHEEHATVTMLAKTLRQANLYILIHKAPKWSVLQSCTQIRQMQINHEQTTYDKAAKRVLT